MAYYTVVSITDGKETWKKTYDNCLEAVEAYNQFVDYGFAKLEQIVTLVEPNGKLHTKIFPGSSVNIKKITVTKTEISVTRQ